MNIHQNPKPVRHEDLHEQIENMLDHADDSKVCCVLLGDVKLEPGRIQVRSSCAIKFPDDMTQDGVLLPAALSGMIGDTMRQNPMFANAVMLAAKMYIENHPQYTQDPSLN